MEVVSLSPKTKRAQACPCKIVPSRWLRLGASLVRFAHGKRKAPAAIAPALVRRWLGGRSLGPHGGLDPAHSSHGMRPPGTALFVGFGAARQSALLPWPQAAHVSRILPSWLRAGGGGRVAPLLRFAIVK